MLHTFRLGRTAKPLETLELTDRKQKVQNRVERVKGIEPLYAAWEAAVLPLNYTRGGAVIESPG